MVKNKNDSEEEQMKFYTKVAEYISKHPEFVNELEQKISEEEKSKNESSDNEKKDLGYFMKNGFSNIKEKDISGLSSEIAGFIFNREKENKSLLEKTLENATMNLVSGYLSKYAQGK
ncbi:MAG: hypothetical protein WC758_05000 [Candidatus Woesearchaeota archaeon]|jgi:hypothetical protein